MTRIFLAIALLAVVGFGALVFVPRGRAQVQVTFEPTMSKGAPGSAVTIVEFSDYQ